jgi:hypothetical protein
MEHYVIQWMESSILPVNANQLSIATITEMKVEGIVAAYIEHYAIESKRPIHQTNSSSSAETKFQNLLITVDQIKVKFNVYQISLIDQRDISDASDEEEFLYDVPIRSPNLIKYCAEVADARTNYDKNPKIIEIHQCKDYIFSIADILGQKEIEQSFRGAFWNDGNLKISTATNLILKIIQIILAVV